MITIADLKKLLSMEQEIIQEQTQGLTHADSLLQPSPGGNCMNWVLGHLVDNQLTLLETLYGRSPINKSDLARYFRDSEPLRAEGPGVLPLDSLLTSHKQVHTAVIERLDNMTETDFSQEITVWDRKMTLGWRVFFLHFHYTYHIGQLELLRNLAGKTEKVI